VISVCGRPVEIPADLNRISEIVGDQK